jgi:phosphoribosyl 1,2-cyclic phosphodiesterase
MSIKTISLQSGSNGNCIYVEAGGVRLLFDAGISGACAKQRLAAHGRRIRDVDALIISHEHIDHIRGAGVFHRLFHFPIYATRITHSACRGRMGRLGDLRFFTSGDTLEFGPVAVHTFRTPHDAADGVAFVIEHDHQRLGVFTDLGHPFDGLIDALGTVDAAYLESNYDPHMLASGPYPEDLKRRITGGRGHLSNLESATLLKSHAGDRLRWVALAHLSAENNHPQLALDTHRQHLGDGYPVFVTSRFEASPVWEI